MAVLDFPDPMQTPPTVKTGSTDDLLSQLAGDEIDRLLAEADVEVAEDQRSGYGSTDESSRPSTEFIAPAPEFRSATRPVEPASEIPSPSQLADAPAPTRGSSLKANEASADDRAEAIKGPSATPLEMGSLLDTLSTTSTRMAPPSSIAASSIAAPLATDSAAIIAAELETSEAERRALSGGAIEDGPATDPGIDPHAFDVDPSQENDGTSSALPLFLRPLEWLNAPFAESGERTREAIGKIALLTLVNAVGVLIYVFFFRRR